jgi:hypothetical protein
MAETVNAHCNVSHRSRWSRWTTAGGLNMKMKANKKTVLSLALQLMAALPALAAEPAKSEEKAASEEKSKNTVKATTGSDAARFEGDVLHPRVELRGRVYRLGQGVKDDVKCVLAGSRLRGGGSVTVEDGSLSLIAVEQAIAGQGSCGNDAVANAGDLLAASPDTLGSALVDRRGWTYGTLIVPYKYQFRGDRSMSGGATVGGYFGWRQTAWATGLQYVVFGGATKVDVPKTNADGAASTESLAGLSYGIGLLGTLKNDFKLGLVVGVDHVTKSTGYINNGKAWISLSLGIDFTQ